MPVQFIGIDLSKPSLIWLRWLWESDGISYCSCRSPEWIMGRPVTGQ